MPGKGLLVTGSHRSGSTWVGQTLARAPGVGYIQEPFSLGVRPGLCTIPWRYWFTYVCPENEAAYRPALQRTLAFDYRLGTGLRSLRSPKDAAWMVRDLALCQKHRWTAARPLMKDPIALFSAEWLADTFDLDVIVLIRHPAAFAGSLKRLNWTHDFNHFLRQPLLMRDHLHPFAEEIEAFASKDQDILDQAALLWKIMHHQIQGYQTRRPDWVFIRHEDLSRDPIGGFAHLFERFGLEMTPQVRTHIEGTTRAPAGEVPDGTIHHLQRNSKANIFRWKDRLTPEEITRIRTAVGPVSDAFYTKADW